MNHPNFPDLVNLVRQHGEQYWLAKMKSAKIAVVVYGIAILVAFAVRFAVSMSTGVLLGMSAVLPWLVMFVATIYAGANQVPLLPFMNSKVASHWVVVIILAIFGCAGILWLAIFMHYNRKAETALKAAIKEAQAPPPSGISPYPR